MSEPSEKAKTLRKDVMRASASLMSGRLGGGPSDYDSETDSFRVETLDHANTAMDEYVGSLEAIVRALADSCPCQPGLEFDYRCRLCKVEMYDTESHEEAEHDPTCAWRRAVEAMKQ